jgi:protein phosphatase
VTVLRSGSATDVGRVRKINQDLPLESANLFAIADGMGGHVGGEVAARVAVEALQLAFDREPTAAGLLDAFAEANAAVWAESQSNPDVRGMGTTLTAVALVGAADGRDTLALCNVGDSRAYVFSGTQMVQITADHSLAEERMRHGEMTEEEAAVHPQRHILTRALGIGPDVEADMWDLQLRSGDRVVLCSDGLSNEVAIEDMASILAAQSDPDDAAHLLVDLANAQGGSDNITVVVVDVLVGEDGEADSSMITPLGAMAGAALVLGGAGAAGAAEPAGAATTGLVTAAIPAAPAEAVTGMVGGSMISDDTMAVPMGDALKPGSQLGFSGPDTVLGEGAAAGAEFLSEPSPSGTVPLARSSMRVPPRPVVTRSAPPGKESWGARRRRLGVPRRITIRVLLFVVMVAAIPVAAFFAIRWYAYDNWYPALAGHQIVIKQGYANGVLWFKPRVVDHTKVTTSQILPPGLAQIKGGVQESSLNAAKSYVANLNAQYNYLHAAAQSGTGANAIGPSGSIPNITAPPPTCATTTTVAGQAPSATPTTTCTTVPGQTTTTGAPTTTTAAPTTTTTAAPVTTTTVALP